METIAERIKYVRSTFSGSQQEFAEKIGVHVNTVRRYERGKSEPDLTVAAKICRLFGISPHWLLLGDGKSEPPRSQDGVPHFYADDYLGFQYQIDPEGDIVLLEKIVEITAKQSEIELTSKQVNATALLYYEEMKRRLVDVIRKVREL